MASEKDTRGATYDCENRAEESDQGQLLPPLPPTDNGPEAWKYLIACFVVEALLWGFPVSFGVFQDYYSRQPDFEGDSNIPVIGTVATSLYFLGAPIAAPIVKRFRRFQRHMVVIGSTICVLSVLIASFVNSIPALIATQGALYGFGFLMLYMPLLFMLNEWFIKRRGFAYGVLYAGGGFSGVGLPFLLEWLLGSYGHKTTLRIVCIAQSVLVAPSLFFLRPRLPSSHHAELQALDLRFLKNPLFWVFTVSNICQGLAYYFPPLYLPSYASDMGMSGTIGAMILAANNLATIFGQIGFGHLTDRCSNIHILVCISTLGASLSAFLLWGFCHHLATLVIFSIVWGITAGAYVVFWPKFGTMLSEDPQPVYSLMALGKGIGNIVTGPISAGLLTRSLSLGSYGLNKYEPAILFVGSLMLISSLAIVGWPIQRLMARRADL
ncbi:unnamed protein product [Clonostachys rhizophaga]|uniref:Uncharacterized protein n=1 Tax=Clonostachys rhizophaga TaxID=160324 RepID=A0A9N9YMI0_9HYPO|nr:unnamed protein product [Clonostachys rhizophaga]